MKQTISQSSKKITDEDTGKAVITTAGRKCGGDVPLVIFYETNNSQER